MQDRVIGRVLSVDNFRVYIKIDDEIKSAYKSGINDIYEVARINSYLIIPVGADRVVAIITRVTMKEEAEIDSNMRTVSLPSSARYILATMQGTIHKEDGKEAFLQGVYNFPVLDNPVWYATEDDLKQIFDDKNDGDINYTKDYYLPIGISPAFSNYTVKICPDQFFVKHAAILGNTGSGKSCTLTSILRNLFKFKYKEKKLQKAHIIILDTNGEYKDAFLPNECSNQLEDINAYYYGGDGKVQVPYWLMNWQEFKALLRPGDGAQVPVLNRAISLAKNIEEAENNDVTPYYLKSSIERVLSYDMEEIKKRTGFVNYGNWLWKSENEILKLGMAVKVCDNELGSLLIDLASSVNFNDASKQGPIITAIRNRYNQLNDDALNRKIVSEKNIDLPTWFSYKELCSKFLNAAISEQESSNARISEFVSTLRLRMQSFLNDNRMAIPLMLKDANECNRNVLPRFLALLLGDFNTMFSSPAHPDEGKNDFVESYNKTALSYDKSRTNQITIIDVSLLPSEVLEIVTALLGRIILEFVSNFMPEERGTHPIVIVLEEAQNYIAEKDDSVAKRVFERIAREGRKFGISLIVSSQRPSELSKTVLSQCNSFVIHRLQNPEDQKYVRGLVSSASADILDQLPVLPQKHAILTGDCVRTPIQVRIDNVSPTPNSHDPEFIKNWLDKDNLISYDQTCMKWRGEEANRGAQNVHRQESAQFEAVPCDHRVMGDACRDGQHDSTGDNNVESGT